LPGAVDLLHRLSERYAVTAVISGRPLDFLREHLTTSTGDRLVLVGLYGLEQSGPGGTTVVTGDAERWRSVMTRVADDAESELPSTVEVEPKGLAVTLHVRRHQEQSTVAEAWAARIAHERGLAVYPGRWTWELRPPVVADKGTAAEELAIGLQAVCYLGDDLGDLPAFAALDRLRAAGVHTVKVAVRSHEAPPEVIEAADLVVDGPVAALAWLQRLG
jgi:trehalose 6-phosphate phosphatase